MTTKEKRKHARSPFDIPVEFIVQGQSYDGLIKNKSKGGIFIETKGTFSVGQKIFFNFRRIETIFGTIAWVNPQGIGVKFGKLKL